MTRLQLDAHGPDPDGWTAAQRWETRYRLALWRIALRRAGAAS